MRKENVLTFTGDYNNKKTLRAFMVFEIEECMRDSPYDYERDFGCYEDVEHFMKLYFKKNWRELFCDHPMVEDIVSAQFKGFAFRGREDSEAGSLTLQLDDRLEAWVKFDVEKVGEENAKTLNEIRKILG